MDEKEPNLRPESSAGAGGEGKGSDNSEESLKAADRGEEIKNIYTKKVPSEALDSFDDEIDRLSGFSKNSEESAGEIRETLGEDLQDRLAEIVQQMRDGVSAARLVYDAVREAREAEEKKNDNCQRLEDLEEVGRLIASQPGDTGDDTKKTERARQFGEVLQRVAQTQQVFLHSRAWLKQQDVVEEGYLRNRESELNGFADREDVPKSMKDLVKLAAEKLSSIKEEADVAASQEADEGEPGGERVAEIGEEPVSSGSDQKEKLAGEESSSEFVNRPIFEKEAIKREDLRAVEGQLRELAEKNDPRSVFGLARQLAYLKRAGVKMSDKGHDYFAGKLQEQSVAVRERGARAVAQYHVYLKYLKAETELSEEDRVIIRNGLREGVVGNKGKVASLAVNAKYLGVVKNADMMRDDLQADMKIQLEGGASADKVALEMARRKYLEMSYELPDNQSHYQQRIDNKLEGYAQEGQWDNYAKLKSHVDYVRGDKAIEQGRREQVVGHVEERAKLARESGDWGAYTSYVADAVHLSRRHEQIKGEGDAAARRDDGADLAVNLEAVQEELRAKEKERQAIKEKKESPEAEEKKDGQKKEPERVKSETPTSDGVDSEMSPERTAFAEAAKEHNESQERRADEENGRADILTMNEDELKSREEDLLRRRELESRGEAAEEKWANETMEKIREGADFGEVLNEGYMVGELKKHKVREPKREAARQRYLEILRNDFGHTQDLENPTVMDKATSLWMESWYARVKVAGGAGKLKAMWPGGEAKRGAWRNVISARQDVVDTMKRSSEDGRVDKRIRALFKRMATEYGLLNIRDTRALRKREPALNAIVERDEKPPVVTENIEESDEDKLKKEVKRKYKKKYKKKYQGKYKKRAGRRGKKEKAA